MIGLPGQTLRPTKHLQASELAGTGRNAALSRDWRPIEIELHVPRNKQIEQTVVIIIAPCRSGGPATQSDSGFFSDVGESAIMIGVGKAVSSGIRNATCP